MKLLNQILWEGKNKWQIYGAAVGAFLGLLLVLTAFQFYHDLNRLIRGDNATDQYVIINKKVNLFNTLGANAAFTDDEIDSLKSQDFILEVGEFNSNQYNSIIVPQKFLEWSNNQFGNKAKSAPSRVILKTNNPYSTDLQNLMKAKNYEVSSGKLIGGKLTAILQGVISAIAVIGFIIVLLSVLVFVLNFQLIISQSQEDIRLLLQMGYKNKQVSDILNKRLLRLFAGIFLAVIISIVLSRFWFAGWFEEQGLNISANLHWSVYLIGILLSISILFFNFRTIKKSFERLF